MKTDIVALVEHWVTVASYCIEIELMTFLPPTAVTANDILPFTSLHM